MQERCIPEPDHTIPPLAALAHTANVRVVTYTVPFARKQNRYMPNNSGQTDKHKNDPYGDIGQGKPDERNAPPPIPAATVILLRDDVDTGLNVLMLRKTSKISFGGMWVFPGGKIDADDYPADGDVDVAARNAAVRETAEEANLSLEHGQFVEFAHWTPPPTTPKRFATWFFLAPYESTASGVEVDGGEIEDHQWVNPAAALEQHAAGKIDLVPPTWVSLYQLSKYSTSAEALAATTEAEMRRYFTRLAKRDDGVRVAMWDGDAGYADWDANATGATHRLTMATGGFVFEHSAAEY